MPVLATEVLWVAISIGRERFPRRRWMAESQVPPHRVMAPWRAGSCIQEEGLLWLPRRLSSSRLASRESWQPMALALRGGTYIPWDLTVTLKRQDDI